MIIVEAAKNPIKIKRDIYKYNGISYINNEANVDESVIKKALSNKAIINDFLKKANKIIEDRYNEYIQNNWSKLPPSVDEVKKAATIKSAIIDYNGSDKDHYQLTLLLYGVSDKFFNNRGSVEGHYILNKDGSLFKIDDVYFDGSD